MSSTRQISDKQERLVADRLKLKTVSGSGSSPFEKGDVKGEKVLIECKTKMKESKSFTIQREWLDKLKIQARGMGKPTYALAFSFGDDENYYILTEQHMKEYLDLLQLVEKGVDDEF